MQEIRYSSEPMASSSAKAALVAKNSVNTMTTPVNASTRVVEWDFSITPSFDMSFEILDFPGSSFYHDEHNGAGNLMNACFRSNSNLFSSLGLRILTGCRRKNPFRTAAVNTTPGV
jgi:hypothetical protein